MSENKGNYYNKYLEFSNELIRRAEILKFISTHVNKYRKNFRVTEKLINDAKEYFKNYPEDAFKFLESGEYIKMSRNKNRQVAKIEYMDFNEKEDMGATKIFSYNDKGEVSSVIHYRQDVNEKRGIHQLNCQVYYSGKIKEIEGHARFNKNEEEHVIIHTYNDKADDERSRCLNLKDETLRDLLNKIVDRRNLAFEK